MGWLRVTRAYNKMPPEKMPLEKNNNKREGGLRHTPIPYHPHFSNSLITLHDIMSSIALDWRPSRLILVQITPHYSLFGPTLPPQPTSAAYFGSSGHRVRSGCRVTRPFVKRKRKIMGTFRRFAVNFHSSIGTRSVVDESVSVYWHNPPSSRE